MKNRWLGHTKILISCLRHFNCLWKLRNHSVIKKFSHVVCHWWQVDINPLTPLTLCTARTFLEDSRCKRKTSFRVAVYAGVWGASLMVQATCNSARPATTGTKTKAFCIYYGYVKQGNADQSRIATKEEAPPRQQDAATRR